jgi:hypothetical protein
VTFHRLQAPAEDGDWLAHPDPGVWRDLLHRNVENFKSSNANIGGRPWAEWRALVRSEIEESATVSHPIQNAALIVSGHQPELVHPGVWIKNFAAIGFAESIGGRALHVVTDNDLLKRTTVAVPGGTLESPLVAQLPFDQWTGEEPFEDRRIEDEPLFGSFADRAATYLQNLPYDTLLPNFWRYAKECESPLLKTRFSQPRSRLECEWGADGDETTLSGFCLPSKRGFFLLAADVMLRAAEYREVYNDELHTFRRKLKIRSTHHPAPELESSGEGVEVPFWAWKPGGRRHRPFVAQFDGRFCLTAGGETITKVSLPATGAVDAIAESLADLTEWKIRPRALMTTTFLRLGVADLFIHGLGGAKYDEWNDAVIRRFWNIEPPAYVMITATLRLPLGDWNVDFASALRDLERRRRDLEWNPERYIDDALMERSPICDWVEEKAALQETKPPTKKERRARFRRFRELNQSLREFVSTSFREATESIQQAEADAAARSLMGSREFFFGFHSAQSLRSLLLPWLDWSQTPRPRRLHHASSL